jgi:hypothetical protein
MYRTMITVVVASVFAMSGIGKVQMAKASTDSSHSLVQDRLHNTLSIVSTWMLVTNQNLRDEFRLDGLPPLSRRLTRDREQFEEFKEWLKQRQEWQEQQRQKEMDEEEQKLDRTPSICNGCI